MGMRAIWGGPGFSKIIRPGGCCPKSGYCWFLPGDRLALPAWSGDGLVPGWTLGPGDRSCWEVSFLSCP